MPKRVGFLYEKMVDRDFIRRVILDSARYRHSRYDVAAVLADLDKYVERAYAMLALGTYTPSRPKEKTIYDASCQKYRKIKMVPYWPDGIMQWLLVAAMKPVLMRGMYHWSCASVPDRGTKRVHGYLQRAMRRDPKGTRYASEILGVSFLKVLENVFEHNEGVVFGKSKQEEYPSPENGDGEGV